MGRQVNRVASRFWRWTSHSAFLFAGYAARLIARLGVQIERFSWPLPSPEVLEKYNAIEPGFANRIPRMAESQAQHRQSLETTVVTSRTRSEERGQKLAAFVVTVIGLGAFGLVALEHPVDGVVTVVAEIAGLAGVFIYGRRKQEKELKDKSTSLAPMRCHALKPA